jgi:hypothetical protein
MTFGDLGLFLLACLWNALVFTLRVLVVLPDLTVGIQRALQPHEFFCKRSFWYFLSEA